MVIQDREITQEKQKEHHLVPDVRCPGCGSEIKLDNRTTPSTMARYGAIPARPYSGYGQETLTWSSKLRCPSFWATRRFREPLAGC